MSTSDNLCVFRLVSWHMKADMYYIGNKMQNHWLVPLMSTQNLNANANKQHLS